MKLPMLAAMTVVAGTLASQTATAAEFLITSITELTGSLASQGVPLSRGMKLAADEINASGYLGEDKIKLVQLDNGSDRGQAALLVNQANASGSIAIIGTATGYVSHSIAPLANELKVPLMGMVYSVDLLKPGPYSVKITSSDDSHTISLARYVTDVAKPKRCLIIYANDNPGFIAQYKTFREYAEKQGIEFIGEEAVSLQDTDFSALATKITALAPDCLHISMTAPGGANLITQALQAGMDPATQIFAGAGFANQQLMKVGGAAVENVVVSADFVPGGVNEEGKKFSTDYEAAFESPAENWSAVGYAQMKLIAYGLKQAGSSATRETLLDAIRNVKDVPTILGAKGTMSITDRLPEYDAAIIKVKDGSFVNAQ
ncbi:MULTISPECIES: ABC transporter substrate-binding protein [unclassified Mesorhizobium]|uniref:ABC transporter substrate-binding protein n=1 Tax=unclassified Mesorhizobium TaxID=325217 RepID=UPI003014BEE4